MIRLEEPIECAYFNWLSAKVFRVENPTPSLTYWKLFRELQNTEFVWLVPLDDNRAEDGKELRREFLRAIRNRPDEEWLKLECSVFEMIIAFSKRAEYQTDRNTKYWFWHFLDNLGLTRFNDASFNEYKVADILDRFIWRTYNYHGNGGMFPIEHPRQDQRKVEIWYQFCEYLIDRGLI